MHILYAILFISSALVILIVTGFDPSNGDGIETLVRKRGRRRRGLRSSASEQTAHDHELYLRMLHYYMLPDEYKCAEDKHPVPRQEMEEAIDGFCKGTIGPETVVAGRGEIFSQATDIPPAEDGNEEVGVKLGIKIERETSTVLRQETCIGHFNQILNSCDALQGGSLLTAGILYTLEVTLA